MIDQPVRALTLDVHGTLIHSPRLGEIYAEVLGRHGVTVRAEEALRVVRLVWQELSCARRLGQDRFSAHPEGARGWWYRFIDRVCEHLGAAPASPFGKVELFERFTRADAWEIYAEVPSVLAALEAARVRMAVLSNWDDRLPVLLERLGLADYFESIVFSAGVGAEKPFPKIFLDALARLELPAEQVVHVGDREREDVEGARAVGMQALRIDRSGETGDLHDLSPLVDLLRSS